MKNKILSLHKKGHTIKEIADLVGTYVSAVHDVVTDESIRVNREFFKTIHKNFKPNLDLTDYSGKYLMMSCYR